jgi:hypothetical protein
VEFLGEMLIARCMKLTHNQGSKFTMSYPMEKYIQNSSPKTMSFRDVLPRDVPSCYWNNVEEL